MPTEWKRERAGWINGTNRYNSTVAVTDSWDTGDRYFEGDYKVWCVAEGNLLHRSEFDKRDDAFDYAENLVVQMKKGQNA